MNLLMSKILKKQRASFLIFVKIFELMIGKNFAREN